MHRIPSSRIAAGVSLIILTLTAAAASTTEGVPPESRRSGPAAITAPAGTPSPAIAAMMATVPEAEGADPALTALPDPTPDPDSAIEASAIEALRALSSRVTRSSADDALRTAFEAYYNYRTSNPGRVKKPYLYYVDMGLDNSTARGYVFDMDRLAVVDGPFNVAHGSGSSRTRDAVPTTFSNRSGSNATSLGLYLAQETYRFSGKVAGRRYSSVGLRMRGESGSFNSAARARGIVAHGAPYVTRAQAGRSQGCPAMEMERAQRLLPMIANGGVVFIYSPNDERWLSNDPWLLGD